MYMRDSFTEAWLPKGFKFVRTFLLRSIKKELGVFSRETFALIFLVLKVKVCAFSPLYLLVSSVSRHKNPL